MQSMRYEEAKFFRFMARCTLLLTILVVGSYVFLALIPADSHIRKKINLPKFSKGSELKLTWFDVLLELRFLSQMLLTLYFLSRMFGSYFKVVWYCVTFRRSACLKPRHPEKLYRRYGMICSLIVALSYKLSGLIMTINIMLHRSCVMAVSNLLVQSFILNNIRGTSQKKK